MICGHCQKDIEKCTHARLHEQIRLFKALDAARQKIQPSVSVMMVRSLISHRNHKPRIDIQLGEIHTQMNTDSALDVATNIIKCAMGSYADGFIFNFVTEKLGLEPEAGAMVIQEFREYREKLAEEFKRLQDSKDG